MVVTVIEKWNGELKITPYHFTNENQMREFIKLCNESNCLVLEPKLKRKRKAS